MKYYTQTSSNEPKIYDDELYQSKFKLGIPLKDSHHLQLCLLPTNKHPSKQQNMIINSDLNAYTRSLFNPDYSIDEKLQTITQIVKPTNDYDNFYDVIQLRVQITPESSKNVSNLPISIKNWIRFVLRDEFHNGCITIYKKKTIPMNDIINYLGQEQQLYGGLDDQRPNDRITIIKRLLSRINEYPSFIIVNQSGLKIETNLRTKQWFLNQLTKLSSWIDINVKFTKPWVLTRLIPQSRILLEIVTNDVFIFTKGYDQGLKVELFEDFELFLSRGIQRFDYQLCKYIEDIALGDEDYGPPSYESIEHDGRY
ncbi:hypothetical protein BN7_5387 [Wickerhamomyces ciferrii]|uniref:Uncharacterized protein n=1 Tax=Wickerhamomyces ciferrii (strain ATCC 14091 / BCRC 22168 / CBS 111 / JCM 3599 / NBRC 0793 / NRRL Y-1031 F-60-10) TaxID=1206466 RepID=K0KRR9_WICCF|nr:uncharacterized protein BN7_5387 [Wickerhamomyces ciferrii]CCH45801.1 hypothetical protein BN7_5387 [Wickerhamomyces ciferrii]